MSVNDSRSEPQRASIGLPYTRPRLTIAALALRTAPEIAKGLSLGAGTPIATPAPA